MDEVSSEISLLLNLPFEMHSVILQFLDVPDILNARQVCNPVFDSQIADEYSDMYCITQSNV